MTVLSTGVMSQTAYGADDEGQKGQFLLTSDEEKFYNDWKQLDTRLKQIIVSMQKFSSDWEYQDYKKRMLSENASEVIREIKKTLDFEGSCKLNTAPTTFRDIQTEWNTKVCSQYAKIRLAAEIALVPGITRESWLALYNSQKEELEYLDRLRWQIEEMILIRRAELHQQREKAGINPQAIEKEVKEEVKKEQSKKDEAGKPEGDSDDLFDFNCFIATAAYGTPTAKEIDELRRFRDEYLRKNYLGNEFIKFYYANSPPIADFISEHEVPRTIVREGFVDPVVKIVEFTENWWAE